MADGHGVPIQAREDVGKAPVEDFPQQKGGVRRRAATGIVRDIGDHDRAGRRGGGPGQRLLVGCHHRRRFMAQIPDLPSKLLRQIARLGPVAIGDHQHAGGGVGHIAPGKTMRQGDGENTVPALQFLHAGDEGFHGLVRGAPGADHAAIMQRHHRVGMAQMLVAANDIQFLRPLGRVDVGIFLEGDQGVRRIAHGRRDGAMQVQLAADHRIGADHGAATGQQIALAIIIAVRHHGPVHGEEDHVHRQGGLQI